MPPKVDKNASDESETEADIRLTNKGILKILSQQREMLELLINAHVERNNTSDVQPSTNQTFSSERLMESISKCIKNDFVYDAENNVTFKVWFSKYRDLFTEDAKDLDDGKKVRVLLRKLGSREHQQYLAHILPKEPKDFSFDETIKTLEVRFGLKETVFRSRFKCLRVVKNSAEDYFTYAGRINTLVQKIEYQKMTEDDFKCLLFIIGLNSHGENEVREKLLSVVEKRQVADTDDEAKKLTIDQLVVESERFVSLRADNKAIESHAAPAIVNFTKHATRSQKKSPTNNKISCYRCGGDHLSPKCTYQGICGVCCKKGHKDELCKSRDKKKEGKELKKLNAVFSESSSFTKDRKFVELLLSGQRTKLQLDTASDITIISHDNWKKIGSPSVIKTEHEIISASDNPVKMVGYFESSLQFHDITRHGKIFVSPNNSLNILGIDFIKKFNWWSVPFDTISCNKISRKMEEPAKGDVETMLEREFPEVFTDQLGKCTKVKPKLLLKPDVKPVFRNKRPVPYAVAPLLDETLTRLENAGVISKVDYSEWAAPIVTVKKANGDLRPCADYSTGLNDALEPHPHPLPTPEEIFAKLADNEIFSHIDLSDAYFQVEMDDDSKKLLTINTHRGLYKFNRLSQGVKPATGIFQQIMDAMLSGINGSSAFLDDIIVGGKTKEENLKITRLVLERLRDYGFTLKLSKCKFLMPRLKYLGVILDKNGLHPDPEKIQAICELSPPTDVTGIRSLIGGLNWYRKFIPNMSELQAPFDKLLMKDVPFEWNDDCETSFKKFKEILKSDMVLTHYDPALPIIVSADASSIGIGATIAHKMPNNSIKVIAYASRSLSNAEKRYAQIEREALALIFAVTKFHRYICGRHFLLETDHKPLLRIFGSEKGIPTHTANRLQRWALILLNYDFEITYIKTTDFGNADILSRLIDQQVKHNEDFVVSCAHIDYDTSGNLIEIAENLPVTVKDIQTETEKDEDFHNVKNAIITGEWPKNPSNQIAQFQSRKDSLSVVDNCIMFFDRVVIPPVLQRKVLNKFHRGHPGIVRMKAIARSFAYWPGIDKQIEDHVNDCNPCQSVMKNPGKVELESWPIPTKPWSRLHIDIAGPTGMLITRV